MASFKSFDFDFVLGLKQTSKISKYYDRTAHWIIYTYLYEVLLDDFDLIQAAF